MSRLVIPLVGAAASASTFLINAHSAQAKNHVPPIKEPAAIVQKAALQNNLPVPTFSQTLKESAKVTGSVLIGKTFVPPTKDPEPVPTTFLSYSQDPISCNDPRTQYPSNPPCLKEKTEQAFTTIVAQSDYSQDPRSCADPRTQYPSNPPCSKTAPNLLLAFKQTQPDKFKLVN